MKRLLATLTTSFVVCGYSIAFAAAGNGVDPGSYFPATGYVHLAQYTAPVPVGVTGGKSGGPNQAQYVKKGHHKSVKVHKKSPAN